MRVHHRWTSDKLYQTFLLFSCEWYFIWRYYGSQYRVRLFSLLLGIVFYIRNLILLGFNHQKTLLMYAVDSIIVSLFQLARLDAFHCKARIFKSESSYHHLVSNPSDAEYSKYPITTCFPKGPYFNYQYSHSRHHVGRYAHIYICIYTYIHIYIYT